MNRCYKSWKIHENLLLVLCKLLPYLKDYFKITVSMGSLKLCEHFEALKEEWSTRHNL